MSDKILCPWCGSEMFLPIPWQKGLPDMGGHNWIIQAKCLECGALSPKVYGRTEQEAENKLFAATTCRYTPPKPIEEDDANKAQMPEWISVKDKLPENDSHYLVFASDTCEVVECIYYGDGEWMTKDLENMTDCVTHWMPLPKHPEEGALNGV